MAVKEFLEDSPLFKKYPYKVNPRLNQLPKPAIHMKCEECNSEQTFNMVNDYWEPMGVSNHPTGNQICRLKYLCQSCNDFLREFYIFFSPDLDYMYKIGQYPAWEIKLEKNLEKLLQKHSKNYRNGLVCESQGYGIGAYAYYRRITEELIDELLDSIYDLIDKKKQTAYKDALDKTKSTHVAQDKIELVKDLLPEILRPEGMNPLGILHKELSEGIHDKTDADCLEIAGHIREILTFLVNQIMQSRESAKHFTSSMQKILDKKNKGKEPGINGK